MKIKYILVILSIMICLIGCNESEEEAYLDDTDLLMAGPVVVEDEVSEDDTILVFVCGEVNNPGVYEFKRGERVCDAILRAGDFTQDADTEFLNQAAELSDGQKLYVPSENESTAATEQEDDGLVNINTATTSQLKTLPGIGDVKAEAIISYRDKNGSFEKIEDIKQVDGIKSGLYDSIKDMITVN